MKKYLIAILAALMCGVAAQAQVRFGVKAGLDINKLHFSGNNNFSSENRAGFTGGFMTEFTVPIVGLCFDASLMYTRMNGELHSPKDLTIGHLKLFLHLFGEPPADGAALDH